MTASTPLATALVSVKKNFRRSSLTGPVASDPRRSPRWSSRRTGSPLESFGSGSSAHQEEAPPGPAAEASGADSGQGKGVPTPRPSNQPLVGRRGNWVARFLVFVLMRNLDYDPVPGVVLPASAEPFVLVVVEVLKSIPRRLAGCGAAIFSFPAKISFTPLRTHAAIAGPRRAPLNCKWSGPSWWSWGEGWPGAIPRGWWGCCRLPADRRKTESPRAGSACGAER